MKKSLLATVFSALALSSFAQTDISLNINHLLGNNTFAFNTSVQNNLGHDFNVNRMEYYISEVTLTHDGGTVTVVDDLWILVNADNATQVNLGNYAITNLENISFGLGVDPAHNNLDPATYPSQHPLAPKMPSMHWGWASGYRFVAMEGSSGQSLNQVFELHGLGNDNYFNISLATNIMATNGSLNITLDADYAEVLRDMDINSGVISHGETGEAKTALENMRDYVFSVNTTASSVTTIEQTQMVEVFPNPTTTGTAQVMIHDNTFQNYTLVVNNVLGQTLQQHFNVPSNQQKTLEFEQNGFYIISVLHEGETVANYKIQVK